MYGYLGSSLLIYCHSFIQFYDSKVKDWKEMEIYMKKFIAGLLTLCILVTTPGMVSHAANTSDKPITIHINAASSGKYTGTTAHNKFNSTKVYVYAWATPVQYVFVQTWGDRSTGTYHNETKGTTATVRKGVRSSITNYCFERRTSGAQFVSVKPKFKSTSAVTGTLKADWSPDSTRNYTVVN